MLDVLQAFFRDKNGGTRKETRRREVGNEQMYRAYRTWVLHVWELEGAPETWRAQLEAYYRQQPVFAVIGGIGGGSWQPVHAFCEGAEVPCVFPDVDYPVVDGAGYYSALFLARDRAGGGGAGQASGGNRSLGTDRIVQVFRDDDAGTFAGAGLARGAAGAGASKTIIDYPLRGQLARCPPSSWSGLLRAVRARPSLVVWLDTADVQGLVATGEPPAGLQTVYLSASLSAMRRPSLPDSWLEQAAHGLSV